MMYYLFRISISRAEIQGLTNSESMQDPQKHITSPSRVFAYTESVSFISGHGLCYLRRVLCLSMYHVSQVSFLQNLYVHNGSTSKQI